MVLTVTAAYGEDNLAARVLEGVSRPTNPFLELRQGIFSALGEWSGLSSGETVVVMIVVDLFDQPEWF